MAVRGAIATRWVIFMYVVVPAATGGLVLAALNGGIIAQLTASLVGFAGVALMVAVVRATAWSSPRTLPEYDDPSAVARTPRVIVVSIVAAWVLAVPGVLLLALARFIGSSDISLIFILVAALGALGSIPDLVRLTRGRLHAWRVDADPDGIRVTGYRSTTAIPWSQVRQITTGVDGRIPFVAVKTHGQGETRAPVLAFDFTAEQLADRLKTRKRQPRV